MVLLTPGPCMTSETVRHAASAADLNHRDPAFAELLSDTKRRLLTTYEGLDEFLPCLIGGSGTAAVEAMVTSMCPAGEAVLVLSNGYYSARISEILAIHGIEFTELAFDWLAPLDLAAVETALRSGRYTSVVATHHETTSGRLNPVGEVASIARRHGARVLIDAMSSFGADPIELGEVDAICASANKCLHGLPGVSFVCVRSSLRGFLESVARRTLYLSLAMYLDERPPLTPPVPALRCLNQALRELPRGGAAARGRAYAEHARLLREGLAERGFKFAIDPSEFSCSLTVATLPRGWSWQRWFDANLEQGFMLYECKGPLRERFFQAANMGELTDEQLNGWLLAVDDLLGG